MRVYRDLELVEHLGSGLNRILGVYDRKSFFIDANFMKNIFYFQTMEEDNVGVNVGINVGVNVGVNEIYTFIKENQPIKANKISEKFNQVTQRTVERWIKQLKQENKIEFLGSPKTGGYFVV